MPSVSMLASARRVTALANATDPFSKPFLEQIKLGGEATGTTPCQDQQP
jgi:putative ABC transport system substrate-binding protein